MKKAKLNLKDALKERLELHKMSLEHVKLLQEQITMLLKMVEHIGHEDDGFGKVLDSLSVTLLPRKFVGIKFGFPVTYEDKQAGWEMYHDSLIEQLEKKNASI